MHAHKSFLSDCDLHEQKLSAEYTWHENNKMIKKDDLSGSYIFAKLLSFSNAYIFWLLLFSYIFIIIITNL